MLRIFSENLHNYNFFAVKSKKVETEGNLCQFIPEVNECETGENDCHPDAVCWGSIKNCYTELNF